MGSWYTEEGEVMFEKKVSESEFCELRNDFWKLQDKFNSLCTLLNIGFTDAEQARFVVDMDLRERLVNLK